MLPTMETMLPGMEPQPKGEAGVNPAPEKTALPQEAPVYRFNAYHLAEALKLKEIAKLFDLKPAVLNPNRLVYELSENCYCVFYNFGSVVFFNVDTEVQKTTLERIKHFLPGNAEAVTTDEFILEVERKAKNSVSFDKVVVDKLNRDKIELVALILAQSTALEYFENRVEAILNQLGKITEDLAKVGRTRLSEKEIRQFIGEAMAAKQSLIGTLYLLEKPEETWESKVLDDLHQEATLMFELKERFRTLDYKLKTIQENLELLGDFTVNRQHLRLEWAIVALIVLEVILFGYDLFLR